jgi:hypothetical protein
MNMTASICDPDYRVSGGQEMDTLLIRVPEMLGIYVGEMYYFMQRSETKMKVVP